MNQRHYERLLLNEVKRYQDRLYLNDWTFYARFHLPMNEAGGLLIGDEEVARIRIHGYNHRGDIDVNPRLKPELYPWAVAHELLHARLYLAERLVEDYEGAIGRVACEQMHADLDFIARALTGAKMTSDGDYCLPRPPWVRA